MSTTHEHGYVAVWRCEHPELAHEGECSRGRWIHVCRCGEPGYELVEASATDRLIVSAFKHAALAWGVLLGLLALISWLFPEARP